MLVDFCVMPLFAEPSLTMALLWDELAPSHFPELAFVVPLFFCSSGYLGDTLAIKDKDSRS